MIAYNISFSAFPAIEAGQYDYAVRPRLLETQHNLSYEMNSEGFGAGISCFAAKQREALGNNPLLRLPVQDINYVLRPNICRRKDHYMTSWEQSFLEVAHEYFGK